MVPGVAAGHPATADAAWATLEHGGTAADAAVAGCLASCVAETVMTGLLGGGFAVYWDSASGSAANLDFFVNVPGLGEDPREPELIQLEVPFGEELVHYAVGPASCAVPGVPAGLDALWRRYGRLPWASLVEPALRLARDGVELPPAHADCLAMLAPVMTMDAGARIYSPGGRLLEAGDVLRQPGLVTALGLVADEGAATVYRGSLAEALLELMSARRGLLGAADLAAYEPSWGAPEEVRRGERRLLTRSGLAGVAEAARSLPHLAGTCERDRVLAFVEALESGDGSGSGDTTNLTVVDAEGNACVLTTSLGLGSGDFVPELDLHLNSMLGEHDLVREPLVPGKRMASMMAPTLVVDSRGLELAAGAAGGTRLRTALLLSAIGVVEEGLAPQAAIERPRFHPAGATVHAEPGVDESALEELEARGRFVRRWPGRHHYFGGVSAIGRAGAGADPRRSGATRTALESAG
jgi:gamma-glutamyltranspeptidase/glutathione hydrolase